MRVREWSHQMRGQLEKEPLEGETQRTEVPETKYSALFFHFFHNQLAVQEIIILAAIFVKYMQ
jgi:hypothetical protein